MSQYCDSVKLENNWFHWILAKSTPTLEKYRELGLLWTKVDPILNENGKVITRGGNLLRNPNADRKLHCIATAMPYFFESHKGNVPDSAMCNGMLRSLPQPQDLTIESESEIHCLYGDIFLQQDSIVPSLKEQGYILERPNKTSWDSMLTDINNICQGIAVKFNQPNVEEQQELASEALLQVVRKLTRDKLVYKPGKAPVFNLLTTTVHNCMYSIMNRRTSQRNGMNKLIKHIENGAMESNRSFRVN